jgi:hypothetical protein
LAQLNLETSDLRKDLRSSYWWNAIRLIS